MSACMCCTHVHGCGCMLWMSFISVVFLGHYLLCLLGQVFWLYLDLTASVSLTSHVQANHCLQFLRTGITKELPLQWSFSSCAGSLNCVPYTRKTNILPSELSLGCYFDDFQIWLLIFNTQETSKYLNKTNLVFPTIWNQLKIVIILGHIKQKYNLNL